MKFVGRQDELAALERQHGGSGFVFDVIYGRRRIGKTWLIQRFITDKPAIYFMGIEADGAVNLQGMSRAVHTYTGQGAAMAPFSSYQDLFSYLGHLAQDKRIVFVIDEYPYLAASVPEISSLLQRFCDHEWRGGQLQLILCGSSMSFMERQVLGAKSPLYGRRSSQIHLKPFTYFESREMLSSMSRNDAAVLHCATGGVPEYLRYVDTKESLSGNLRSLFLTASGRLFEEPSNLLKQELREPRVYNGILNAIACGASRNSEIASKIGLNSGALNHYLDSLSDLGIVQKEKPAFEKQGRKTIYRITDGCFRFWYRFVMPNLSAVMSGLGERVYDQVVLPALPDYMGQGFEQIFLDHFDRWNKTGVLPDLFTNRSRWWGNNPALKKEEEIDLVAEGTMTTAFGEAKWRNEKLDESVIRGLERKSALVPAEKRLYLLLSRSGHTKGAQAYAAGRDDIRLMAFE